MEEGRDATDEEASGGSGGAVEGRRGPAAGRSAGEEEGDNPFLRLKTKIDLEGSGDSGGDEDAASRPKEEGSSGPSQGEVGARSSADGAAAAAGDVSGPGSASRPSRRRPRSRSPGSEEETGRDGPREEEDDGADEAPAGSGDVGPSGIRRRKIRRHVPSSSSSSSSSAAPSPPSSPSSSSTDSSVERFWREDVDDSNGDQDEEDHMEDLPRPPVLDKEIPKDTSDPITSIIKREMNGLHCPPWNMRQNFYFEHMRSLSLIRRFKLAQKLQGHGGCVNALHFNESGNLLASGSDDLEIIVWDWASGRKRASFDSGHRANVFQSKFLPLRGDTLIASTSRDGQVRLAELDGSGALRISRRLAGHRGPANKLALIADQPHSFLSGGEDAVVFQLDVRENKPTKLLVQRDPGGDGRPARKVEIYSVDASPVNEHFFCTSGRDKFVRIYDRRKLGGEGGASPPLKKFCPHHLIDSNSRVHVTCAVFSPDGNEVLGSYNDEDIYLFKTDHSDGADYRKRFQGHRNSATVKGVNFYGPRAEYVVSGSDCGNVYLWDKDTEAIVNMFKGDETGVVNVLEPHPNLPFLATSGLDDDVKLWYPTAPEDDDASSEVAGRVDRTLIEKTVIRNIGEQKRSQDHDSEGLDAQMLWQLWRRIRRSEERRTRDAAARNGAGGAAGDGDELSTSESDDDDGEDDGRLQCPTS